jgi:beta-galactosidase
LPVADAKFDDSTWQLVNVPHDWVVELPFTEGFIFRITEQSRWGVSIPIQASDGIAAALPCPRRMRSRSFFLRFDGIFRKALLMLNGMYLGEIGSGYTPYTKALSSA